MKRLLVATSALFAVTGGQSALAQTDGASVSEVIVTATRTPTRLSDVAEPVSVVGAEAFADRQAASFAEVLERLPNVDFFGGPRIQGEQPAIRGATGRQLVILIDGARQTAAPGLSTPTFLDPFFIGRAEVLRGASAVLYGSGGIGGAITFSSLDPSDVLADGDDMGGEVRAEYQSADDRQRLLGKAYLRSGPFSAVIGATYGEWGPVRQGGGTKLRPADGDAFSAFAKATWELTPDYRLQLSHLRYDHDDFQPNNPQADASFPFFQNNYAHQRQTVLRLAGQAREGVETLTASVYATRLKTGADRNATVTPALVASSSTTRTTGFTGAKFWDVSTGSVAHRVTLGADGYRDKIGSLSDGLPGTVSPDGEQTSFGGFVREEATLLPWLTVSGALRYDKFETELKSGAFPKTSDDRISPLVSVTVRPWAGALIAVSRNEGFRAPAVSELYQFLDTPTAFANFRPNPALAAEQSREWNIGAGWSGELPRGLGDLRVRADYFDARVENLITTVVVGFYTNPVLGRRPIQQAQNVAQANREGYEVDAVLRRGSLTYEFGYSQIRVQDRQTGANLFSPPDKWTLGLGWAVTPEVQLRWRSMWVEAQDYDTTLLRRRAAYDVHDAFATWAPTGQPWRVDLGVTNLFDERYAAYKQSTAYPNVYEQGRSARVGLSARF